MTDERAADALRSLLGVSPDFGDRLVEAVADRVAEMCDPPFPQLLTIDGVADITQTSDSTVRRWIDSGHLRALKLGGQWRVRRGDLEEFLDSCEVSPQRRKCRRRRKPDETVSTQRQED